MNKHCTEDALLLMRHEIDSARGNEVFFIGKCNIDSVVSEVQVIARGSKVAVPAILTRASSGDVIIHNHPNGHLEPSDADMEIASVCGNQGIGCAIINNDCSRWYQVVEPHTEQKGELLHLDEIKKIFSPGGVISHLKQFEPRKEQLQMACAVAEAFNHDRVALVEAGTGTGKSLAYLIPAILWGVRNNQRIVISTNTINLQEQLINKDIPFLAKHTGLDFKAVLVKGRSNYACLRKLEHAETEPSLFPDESSHELMSIIEWSKGSKDGCKGDLAIIPRASTWENVCCEADQCSRSQCKFFNRCFFYRARRTSSSAKILVVNHALLLSDIVLRKETGYDATAILPPFTRLIFDEGHHLEDVATSHLSLTVSRGGILKQLHRLVPQKSNKAGMLTILLSRLTRGLPDSMDALYIELSALIENNLIPKSHDISFLAEQTMDWVSLGMENNSNSNVGSENRLRITPEVQTKPFWQKCKPRLKLLSEALADFSSALRTLGRRCTDLPDKLKEKMGDLLLDISGIESRIQALSDGILFIINQSENYCRWIETSSGQYGRQTKLCAAPLDISTHVKENIFDKLKTVVVTSATLTTGGDFNYLKKRGGFSLLEKKRLSELQLPSPFAYHSQVFAAIPDDIPEPMATGFREALQEKIIQAVTISKGGAFILFTSYDLLNRVYSAIAPTLKRNGFATYKQGDTNRHALLAAFRKEGNGILFGTDSFWEGVDVKGEALRMVIIVRLPFQVPTEPVQQARSEKIGEDGGDPFREFSLPQAIIKFRQGFGRLIRSHDDRGAVLIFDRRIVTKNYGKKFLKSLPETEIIHGDSETVFERMKLFFAEKQG